MDNLTYPNGKPVIDPNTGNPYPAPPQMNISNNVAKAQDAGPVDMLLWFFPGQSEDYQRPQGYWATKKDPVHCFKSAYIDLTSYNYGAVMAAAGYTETDTLTYAGLYNMNPVTGNPDNPNNNTAGVPKRNWNSITQGWKDQNKGLW